MKKILVFMFLVLVGSAVQAGPCRIHFPLLNAQLVKNNISALQQDVLSSLSKAFSDSGFEVNEADIAFVIWSESTAPGIKHDVFNNITFSTADLSVSEKKYVFSFVPQHDAIYSEPGPFILAVDYSEFPIYNAVGDLTSHKCVAKAQFLTKMGFNLSSFRIVRDDDNSRTVSEIWPTYATELSKIIPY